MTLELTMLLYSVGLLMLVLLVQATAGILASGAHGYRGDRDIGPGRFQG